MSGHNKWSTIKHKKAATDAKRGKVFSKIAREILVAARQGGGDPSANITLRALIQKARSVNMPADNIDRAIKKGTGELDGGALEEVMFEGYGPGGVGVVVITLTDNRNRTVSLVRHAFTKSGNSLGNTGSVSRTFSRKGVILVDVEKVEEDALMELALESGAEDMKQDGDQFLILTDPAEFMNVVDALNDAEIPMESSEVSLVPETYVPVTDPDQAKKILKFVDDLEDLDDVQNVYGNFDISDEIMEAMEE